MHPTVQSYLDRKRKVRAMKAAARRVILSRSIHQQIEVIAYLLWEKDGGRRSAESYWLEAEQIISESDH